MFIGNLAFQTTKEDLQKLLETAGTITDLFLPTDRMTGQPRGFAFVTYSSDAEATAAIEKFNGQTLDGRSLRVNIAEERPPRPRFDGGGGFNSGGGGEAFFGGGRPTKSKGSRRNLRARKRGG